VRLTPATAILGVLVAVVVGGSVFLHKDPPMSSVATDSAGAAVDAGSAGDGAAVDGAAPDTAAGQGAELVLPDPLPKRTINVPILMYHRIDVLTGDEPAVTRGLTVDPQEFSLEMQWLKDQSYTTITQQQLYDALINGADLPKKPIMITFDDGYRSIAIKAAPIMSKVGFVGTAYIITDRIAKDRKAAPEWMTWHHLDILEQRGWDIGSHTVSHKEIPSLTPEQAMQQLKESKKTLENHLGHLVQWFCYPVGRVDPKAITEVKAAGYVLATTTAPGIEHSAAHPLELSRVRVSDTTGVRGLARALRG